jgi:C-terminal processing protease CtpA/Prc
MFAAAGLPMFILDMRTLPDGAVKEWFTSPHPMRMAGALFDPGVENTQYYSPTELAQTYDAMIFIDETTRARPLKAMPHASMDPQSVAMLTKPRLGVRLKEAGDDKGGAIVLDFLPDSVAKRAGLRADDRIMQVGETKIESVNGVREAMLKFDEGATVPITIERDGQTQTINVEFPKAK